MLILLRPSKGFPSIYSPWLLSWPPWSLGLKKVRCGRKGTGLGYEHDVHGKYSVHLNLHQVTTDCFCFLQLFFLERYSYDMGISRLRRATVGLKEAG